MNVRSKMNSMFPLSVAIVCLLLTTLGAAEKVSLTGVDFSAWRGDTGQWQVVGEAFTDPANEKMLRTKPGTGVIVNGPAGRSLNLLSRAEFGVINQRIQ